MKGIDGDTLKYLGKVLLITLLIVFVCRTFFFESFTISTSQMESALIEGDEVLVSKVSYGPRLPITVLDIPFSFDRFLGMKSYSDLIALPYTRLFGSQVKVNDVVLFNSPLETGKPLDKRSLLLSRCIAVPGDTIMISDGIYYINDKEYVQSPTLVSEYTAPYDNFERIDHLVDSLGLGLDNFYATEDSVYFTLDRYDAFILNRNVTPNLFYRKKQIIPETFMFIVPSKGRKATLSENNTKIYRQIIEYEQGDNVTFEDKIVYINNQIAETYTFSDDYYWMLSDNTVDAIDSRDIGFIPFKNVIGRAKFIIYNSSSNGLDSDRFLRSVR